MTDRLVFSGKYKSNAGTATVELVLISFQDESSVYHIYSPHLDLGGYGYTLEDAEESFKIAFEDFISYTMNKRTLPQVLEELGWKIKSGSRKKLKSIEAPPFHSLVQDNDYISELFDHYDVSTKRQNVAIPV